RRLPRRPACPGDAGSTLAAHPSVHLLTVGCDRARPSSEVTREVDRPGRTVKRAFKYTLLAAAALVGLGGLAVPKIFSGTAPSAPKKTHEGGRPAAAAAAVSVETVAPASLVETIASTGTQSSRPARPVPPSPQRL